MEDLAMVPDPQNRNHNTHVKLILGKEFGHADITYVEAPVYDKKVVCEDLCFYSDR